MIGTVFAATVISWLSKFFGTYNITLGTSIVAILFQLILILTELLKKYVQTSIYDSLYITALMVLLLSSCGIVQSVFVVPAEITTIVSRPLVIKIISVGFYGISAVITFVAPIIFKKFGGFGWIFFIIFLIPSVRFLSDFLKLNEFNLNCFPQVIITLYSA